MCDRSPELTISYQAQAATGHRIAASRTRCPVPGTSQTLRFAGRAKHLPSNPADGIELRASTRSSSAT